MNDFINMELSDLEELQKEYHNQIYNANITLKEITKAIQKKKVNADDMTIKLNPYYKDKCNFVKITINNNSNFKYEVTRISPSGSIIGLDHFNSHNLEFLKYYKACSKLEWLHAIDRLNIWLKGDLLITNYE